MLGQLDWADFEHFLAKNGNYASYNVKILKIILLNTQESTWLFCVDSDEVQVVPQRVEKIV
jgi:hypothetical protein